MSGEFNFADGKLVSHGFHAVKLEEKQAKPIYQSTYDVLVLEHGPGKEEDSDEGDPPFSHTRYCNWTVNGILVGVHLSKTDYGECQVGWGAQAATQ